MAFEIPKPYTVDISRLSSFTVMFNIYFYFLQPISSISFDIVNKFEWSTLFRLFVENNFTFS